MQHIKTVQIELTSRCNMRCIHCIYPYIDKNRDMDSSLLDKLLVECRIIGVEQFVVSGGEPLVHSGFLDVLRKVDEFGMRARVFTNLTLCTDEIISELKKPYIMEVQVSLYSTNPDVHDSITQKKGSCETTLKALYQLVENNIPARISCPIMKQNKRSYVDILKLTKKLGINSVPVFNILARSDHSQDNLGNRLAIDETIQEMQDILENDNAYDAEEYSEGFNNLDIALPRALSMCKHYVAINVNGEVRPMPAWNFSLGNLHAHSLQNIWENSLKAKQIRNITIADFQKCKNCPAIYFCDMSLEGNANADSSGDFMKIPEYECELAYSSMDIVRKWQKSHSKMKN